MSVNDLLNDLLPDPNKLGGHDYTFFLWPRQWAAYNLLDLFNWEIHPFQQDKLTRYQLSQGFTVL